MSAKLVAKCVLGINSVMILGARVPKSLCSEENESISVKHTHTHTQTPYQNNE